jgi:hypothetical protein
VVVAGSAAVSALVIVELDKAPLKRNALRNGARIHFG